MTSATRAATGPVPAAARARRRVGGRLGAGRGRGRPARGGAHRLQHPGVGVPEADRPQPGAVLDVLVAVDVPHVGTVTVRDDRRHALGVLVVRAYTLVDLWKNPSLSGSAKAMWILIIVLLPLLGSVVYLTVREDW